MTHRPTIKTVIHFYKFDTADNEQRAAYKALKDQLNNEAGRPRWMHSHGGDSHHKWHQLDGQTIELETKFIFYNQWNTAPIDGISELVFACLIGRKITSHATKTSRRVTGLNKPRPCKRSGGIPINAAIADMRKPRSAGWCSATSALTDRI